MEVNTSRAEAERLLGIAEKLLQGKDFNGSRDFVILAQETEPLLEGSDQILAVVDVLLAAQRRINNHYDWYAVLQVERRSDDLELIKKQYRRLAFLLHPDKNKFAFADAAFRIVAEAWAVLSDAGKKLLFDNELNLFSKVDLVAMKNPRGQQHPQQVRREQQQQQQQPPQEDPQQKLPVRRSSPWVGTGNTSAEKGSTSGDETTKQTNFWTACPYCYNLYEYPRAFVDCCLRCQNCERAFHAASIPSLPPIVPGKDAYHCCWGFFPMGFMVGNVGVPNWMPPGPPPPQPPPPPATVPDGGAARGDGFVRVPPSNPTRGRPQGVPKKRGRPRKNVQV